MEGMIQPLDKGRINPASYDIMIGNRLLEDQRTVEDPNQWQEIRLKQDFSEEEPYLLLPGDFVLVESDCSFFLPEYIAAQFVLKSSRAREGYAHNGAGWCDPGWYGSKLTMQLTNVSKEMPLPLYLGLKIGQMVFSRMSQPPGQSYAETGNYNEDGTVQPSVG